MNWFSLIPMALSALGGLFPSNNSTTQTTTNAQSPALTAAANTALDKATANLNKPYTAYTGERVAGPSASRPAIDSMMSMIGKQVQAQDPNGYQARLRSLMSMGPSHVTAPNLVASGGPSAGYTPPPLPPPLPTPAPTGM